ncbi:MAG: hypothetical protein LW809_04315 [Vampirovibrionales bacterium]|nr:hypothetical protein [Vampirovibrionales bacterium]
MSKVLFLHGWRANSTSMQPLKEFLEENGYAVDSLYLGDYISTDDQVCIQDIAKQMQKVILEKKLYDNNEKFDLIVHSTGGLVAREWITKYYGNDIEQCPVKRFVMLAPANYGSKLATLGKSMLGRVAIHDDWFESGKMILEALELSSPYQWDLVKKDIFGTSLIYGENKILPFVIVGSQPYRDLLSQIVNENGSDGTVRVSAANLNTNGLTIEFDRKEDGTPFLSLNTWEKPEHTKLRFPLAVLPDRDHNLITKPNEKGNVEKLTGFEGDENNLGDRILEALRCSDQEYSEIKQKWDAISSKTASILDDATYHKYSMLNIHVKDDYGQDVEDYFIEFQGPGNNDELTSFFHQHVIRGVHVNESNKSYRCIYLDHNRFEEFYTQFEGPDYLTFKVVAKSPDTHIFEYFPNYKDVLDEEYDLNLHDLSKSKILVTELDHYAFKKFFVPNSTLFVEFIIKREPKENVFKIKQIS